jgi:RHS repeat-associated protein
LRLKKAGGVGGLLSETNSNGTFYAYYDANGNTTEYLNPSGTISAHYEYSPFGKVTVATGTNPDDFSYRFNTKEFEPNTGLVLYQLRPYNAVSGGWLSREPMGEAGSFNLYSFVFNNPLDYFDVYGRNADSTTGGFPGGGGTGNAYNDFYPTTAKANETAVQIDKERRWLNENKPDQSLAHTTGIEGNFIFGIGIVHLEYCDGKCKMRQSYLKLSAGAAVGISPTVGRVNVSGSTAPDDYKGGFWESSVGAGGFALGIDSKTWTYNGVIEGDLTTTVAAPKVPASTKIAYYIKIGDPVQIGCCP